MSYKLSLRNKILILTIALTALTALTLLFVTYRAGKSELSSEIYKQLTSVGAAKKYQIEHYFQDINNFVEILGSNDYTASALKDFKIGFNSLDISSVSKEVEEGLLHHYTDFIERTSKNIYIKQEPDLYCPETAVGKYLQYQYIVNNPHSIGQKQRLLDTGTGTAYNKAHIKYHTYYTELIQKYGFYDIFLIDLDTGDLVYTSFKETDYATNLYHGPYAESNLGKLARELKENRDSKEPILIDYENYRPSYGAPGAFIGIPITEGNETIGALAFQLPVDEINKVMTGNYQWKRDGLGESGETYLVGDDFLMRSISRFFIEDTIGYKKQMKELRIPDDEVEKMYNVGTTILRQRVKTDAVINALVGKQDTQIIKDYRGINVLSSYASVDIPGFNWAIMSEIDLSEAKKPIIDFQKVVFITLALLVTMVCFLALWLSNMLTSPLIQLKEALKALKNGEQVNALSFAGNNEIGVLGSYFNDLMTELNESKKQILDVNETNYKMLINFMPESVAKRLQDGETDLTETHEDVSVIVIDIEDFSDFVKVKGDKGSVELLNELIDAIDEAADKHHVEKLRTIGDTYVASCGMLTQRLDHAKRIIEFADDTVDIINKFNDAHPVFELTSHIGIASGEVVAGIVGTKNFNFDILGNTMDTAMSLKELSSDNAILVSTELKHRMKEFFEFKQANTREVDFEVWEVVRESIKATTI